MALSSVTVTVVSFVFTVLPFWCAAKMMGTGRQGFWEVAWALFVATMLSFVVIIVTQVWGMIFVPLIFLAVLSKMLDASFLRATVLTVIACAISAGVATMLTKL